MFAKKFRISNFNLTQNSKSLIIAEIGINHEGNFEKSLKMINKAKLSGADLVKLQFADVDTDYDSNTTSYKLFKNTSEGPKLCTKGRSILICMDFELNKSVSIFNEWKKFLMESINSNS